jgi:hypothetical protein
MRDTHFELVSCRLFPEPTRDIAESRITILIGDADLGAASPINTITGDAG